MNGQQTFKDSILNIFLSLVPVYIIAEFIIKNYIIKYIYIYIYIIIQSFVFIIYVLIRILGRQRLSQMYGSRR